MTPDIINGSYELLGALLYILNIRAAYVDRQMKGVSLWVVMFFNSWGYWNLYFYWHLEQWASWLAGMVMIVTSTWWMMLLLCYGDRTRDRVPLWVKNVLGVDTFDKRKA